jgi:hypothetical protein
VHDRCSAVVEQRVISWRGWEEHRFICPGSHFRKRVWCLPLYRVSETMLPKSKAMVISRRQAVALAAGAAAFVSGARVTAQTSPPRALPATEPSRVETVQVELDTKRRKTMSYTVSTLLLRNLHDVFGEIDPVRRRAAIDEIFHEDAVFHEPNGIYRGRDEIDRIAGVIKASHPDFRY